MGALLNPLIPLEGNLMQAGELRAPPACTGPLEGLTGMDQHLPTARPEPHWHTQESFLADSCAGPLEGGEEGGRRDLILS